MLVCIAQFESIQDTITGYFFDTINNKVDSIPICEENAVNYYLWVVEADNDCLDNEFNSFSFNPEGHCGNDICEPWLKENPDPNSPDYCDDCDGKKIFGNYTLVFKEYQHLIDRYLEEGKEDNMDFSDFGYQEIYLNGKYDLFFSYAIVQRCEGFDACFIKDAWYINSVVKRTFRDWYVDNNGNETKKWTDLILKRLNVGKGEVVREFWKGNRHYQSSGGSAGQTIQLDKVMSYNFIPTKDRIHLDFMEWDQARQVSNDDDNISLGCSECAWWFPRYRQKDHTGTMVSADSEGEKHAFNNQLPYYWGWIHQTQSTQFPYLIDDFWLDGTNLYGSGTKYVDLINNDALAPDRPPFLDWLVGANSNINVDKSEMRIRLVLYPNL